MEPRGNDDKAGRTRTAKSRLPRPLRRFVEHVDWIGVVIFGATFLLIAQAVVREALV